MFPDSASNWIARYCVCSLCKKDTGTVQLCGNMPELQGEVLSLVVVGVHTRALRPPDIAQQGAETSQIMTVGLQIQSNKDP
eukprot:4136064-Amphidinium_carterae.3